jgi:hypothetical protein
MTRMDRIRPSTQFENFTHTFSADEKFFDALMSQPCGEAFAEMCVWYNWLRQYLNDIQESLADTGQAHGKSYTTWVVAMLAGMSHAISMLMYLSPRGIIHEAGASGRRALEFLGVASHLITDPSKAQYLFEGCENTPSFKKAFLSGPTKSAEELKRSGTKFRFAAMDSANAKACTQLWEIFSRFNVHGDSLSAVASIPAFTPNQYSCAFCNRSLDATAKSIESFKPLLEITAIELASLVGRFGERTQRVKQAGACILVWLNRQDPRWLHELELMRTRLGLAQTSGLPN